MTCDHAPSDNPRHGNTCRKCGRINVEFSEQPTVVLDAVMPKRITPALETLMGHYLDYTDPDPDMIDLTDVARGLAYSCRFGGQIVRFYSVAEHAVFVRQLVIDWGYPSLAMAALHHDSHEAYLGDWPKPLKNAIGHEVFDAIADKLDVAIGTALGFDPADLKHDIIKRADYEALLSEAATLKPSRGVGEHWANEIVRKPVPGAGLPPEYAERLFVEAHNQGHLTANHTTTTLEVRHAS